MTSLLGSHPNADPSDSAPATPAHAVGLDTPNPTGPNSISKPSARPGPPARSIDATPLTVFVVLLGVLLCIADFFVVNVALPSIGTGLHMSSGLLELVVAGYGTPYAVLLVLGGRLGDTFGRRRLFLAGMVGFAVSSMLCGIAPNAISLIVGRALQGASAAMLVPQVLATIQATTTGRRRARAMGLYGAMAGVAVIVGQVAGGLILAADIAGETWRPVFLITVPIALVGFVLAVRHVPPTKADEPAVFDFAGTALLAATLVALLVPVTVGRSDGWPVWSIALLITTPILGGVFWRIEHRIERSGRLPLVPPTVVAHRELRHVSLLFLPLFGAFGALAFALTLAMQEGAHLDTIAAGMVLAPMGLTMLVSSSMSASVVGRFGNRAISAGAVLLAAGMIGVALTVLITWPHVDAWDTAPAMMVAGLGQGLLIGPMMRASMASVEPSVAGAAGGLLVTVVQVALAVGVAVFGSLYLTIAETDIRTGLIVVLAASVLAGALIAGTAHRLPDPRAELAASQAVPQALETVAREEEPELVAELAS